MGGFTKLFSDIITSSIWSEDDRTRIVWITMLALSDQNGFVSGAPSGIAALARVPLEAAKKALLALESPDVESRTPENQGRRIERADGGWIVLNHEKYRNRLSVSKESISARERQRKRRAALKENENGTRTEAPGKPEAAEKPAPVSPANAVMDALVFKTNDVAFRESVSKWVNSRIIHHKIKGEWSHYFQGHVDKLQTYPVPVAIQLLEQAALNQYQGIVWDRAEQLTRQYKQNPNRGGVNSGTDNRPSIRDL